MKKLITLALFVLCYSVLSEAATATFNYTFANPVCSSTVAKGCINGFAVGTMSGTTFTQIAACPLPPVASGTVNGISCTFTGVAPLGPITFAVVATAVDAGGNPIQSIPNAAGETNVTVTPNGPSGIVVVFP